MNSLRNLSEPSSWPIVETSLGRALRHHRRADRGRRDSELIWLVPRRNGWKLWAARHPYTSTFVGLTLVSPVLTMLIASLVLEIPLAQVTSIYGVAFVLAGVLSATSLAFLWLMEKAWEAFLPPAMVDTLREALDAPLPLLSRTSRLPLEYRFSRFSRSLSVAALLVVLWFACHLSSVAAMLFAMGALFGSVAVAHVLRSRLRLEAAGLRVRWGLEEEELYPWDEMLVLERPHGLTALDEAGRLHGSVLVIQSLRTGSHFSIPFCMTSHLDLKDEIRRRVPRGRYLHPYLEVRRIAA